MEKLIYFYINEKKIVKKVFKREYKIQRIDGLPPKQVTPPPEVYERIKKDNILITPNPIEALLEQKEEIVLYKSYVNYSNKTQLLLESEEYINDNILGKFFRKDLVDPNYDFLGQRDFDYLITYLLSLGESNE